MSAETARDWRIGRRVKARTDLGYAPLDVPAGTEGWVNDTVHPDSPIVFAVFDHDGLERYVNEAAVAFEPPCRVCAGEGEEVLVNNAEAGGITREPCYRCEGKGTVPFAPEPVAEPGPECEVAILRTQIEGYADEVAALKAEVSRLRVALNDAETTLSVARLAPTRLVTVMR